MAYTALLDANVLYPAPVRDVLAAAIVGRCDVIVTRNLKDFPDTALQPYALEAQDPDEFLCNHLSLAPDHFCTSIRTVRKRLQNPPYEVDAYLDILTRQGLIATAAELRQLESLI